MKVKLNKVNVENWDGKGKFDPCSLYNWRLDWLENKVKQHRENAKLHAKKNYNPENWVKEITG